jgi:hypothetical protein
MALGVDPSLLNVLDIAVVILANASFICEELGAEVKVGSV